MSEAKVKALKIPAIVIAAALGLVGTIYVSHTTAKSQAQQTAVAFSATLQDEIVRLEARYERREEEFAEQTQKFQRQIEELKEDLKEKDTQIVRLTMELLKLREGDG